MLPKHLFTFLSIAFLPNPGGTSPSIIGTTCPNWQILTIRKYCIEAFYQAYYWKIRRSWKPETIERLCGVCGYVCVCARAWEHICTHTLVHVFRHWVSLHVQHGQSQEPPPDLVQSQTQAPDVSVGQLSGWLFEEASRSPSLRDREYQSYAWTQTPLGAG